MKNVFIVHVDKICLFDGQVFNGFNHLVGDNTEALISFIKEKYGTELIKDENDDFPYFTDGGFKYKLHTENWDYTFTCYDIPFTQ